MIRIENDESEEVIILFEEYVRDDEIFKDVWFKYEDGWWNWLVINSNRV